MDKLSEDEFRGFLPVLAGIEKTLASASGPKLRAVMLLVLLAGKVCASDSGRIREIEEALRPIFRDELGPILEATGRHDLDIN